MPEPLDLFFAERMLKEQKTAERIEFLSSLFQHARQGHLCFSADPSWKERLPKGMVGSDANSPIVCQENRFYLQRNWVYETRFLEAALRLRFSPAPSLDPALLEKLDREPQLLPEQKEAIRHSLENTFSLICGGPGTGKTYTAGFLVLLSGASRLILAAPTGKAAAQLEASLLKRGPLNAKIEVGTLHRILNLQPGQIRTSVRKLQADLVLVDEASMLDISLLTHLLEAIGPSTRLILMGDPDQLPPIDAGSLFAELAALFGVALKKPMRTDDTSIQSLAEAINRGDVSSVEQLLKYSPSVRLLPSLELPEPQFFSQKPDPEQALRQSESLRVLGTLRHGPQGVEALNRKIVEDMTRRARPGQWWAVPILATRNDPSRELYNGTGGILIGQCQPNFVLSNSTAYFPSQKGLRPFSNHPPFEVAFCLSVHKSQGSEFEKVIALFPPGSENFGREALYTAVTRAKREVGIWIDPDTLKNSLTRRDIRESGFTRRFSLRDLLPPDDRAPSRAV